MILTQEKLKAVRRQRLRVESLGRRIELLRSRAEYGQRELAREPGASLDATRDRLAEYVAQLDELEHALTAELIDYEKQLRDVDCALCALPGNREIVLRLRYCEGLSWREVAKRSHYSEGHCRRLAGQQR